MEGELFLWNIEYASLYTATTFDTIARTIMKMDRILSHFFAILCGSLRVIAAGKMKAIHTAAVAPVNWKASQMLGMKFADRKITRRSTAVITENLRLSEDRGLDEEKRSPSKLSRSAWNIMGNTSIR